MLQTAIDASIETNIENVTMRILSIIIKLLSSCVCHGVVSPIQILSNRLKSYSTSIGVSRRPAMNQLEFEAGVHLNSDVGSAPRYRSDRYLRVHCRCS